MNQKQNDIIFISMLGVIISLFLVAGFSLYVMMYIHHDYLGISINDYVVFGIGFLVGGFFLMPLCIGIIDYCDSCTSDYIPQKESRT